MPSLTDLTPPRAAHDGPRGGAHDRTRDKTRDKTRDTAQDPARDRLRERLIEAALPHVVFDGWSKATLEAAIADSGADPGAAHLAFPRGGVDMAMAFHRMMDRRLAEELGSDPALGAMRIREKIAHAVRRRLELVADHREAVRRGATLLALPVHGADGARAIWETADTVWTAIGDTSDDLNWYSKRAILASVYSATVLYWLGDDTPGHSASWGFLDRRIDDVMRFEKLKGAVLGNPLAKAALWLPGRVVDAVRDGMRRAPDPFSGRGWGRTRGPIPPAATPPGSGAEARPGPHPPGLPGLAGVDPKP